MIILITLALISTAAKAELTEEDVQRAEFFELFANPESSEKNICRKVGQILNDDFGVSVEPKNIYEALMAYVTMGYDSFENLPSIEELTEAFKNEWTDKTDKFINEELNNMKFKNFNAKDIETLNQFFNSMMKLNSEFNKESMRIAIANKMPQYSEVNILADVYNKITSTKVSEIKSEANKELQGECSKKFAEFKIAIKEIYDRLAPNPDADKRLQYFSNAINFEFGCLSAIIKVYEKFTGDNVALQKTDEYYTQKLFALYSVIASNPHKSADSENFLVQILHMINIQQDQDLNHVYKNIFSEPIELDGSNNDLIAFFNNINYGRYHTKPLDINGNNYRDYARQFSKYIKISENFNMMVGNAESYALRLKNIEYQAFVINMILGFISTNPDINEKTFCYNFDQYLNSKNEVNPAIMNILKFVNGMRGMIYKAAIEWDFITMMQIDNAEDLEKLLATADERLITNLSNTKHNSENEVGGSEYFNVLVPSEYKNSAEFNTKWFGKVSVTAGGEKKYQQFGGGEIKGINVTYQTTKLNTGDMELNQQPHDQKQQDDGMDNIDTRDKKYNQKKGPGNNDIEGSDEDDNEEDQSPSKYNQKKRSGNSDMEGSDEDNDDFQSEVIPNDVNEDQQDTNIVNNHDDNTRIHEYKETLENIIHATSGDISQKTLDALKKQDLLNRVKKAEAEGLIKEKFGVDKVMYLTVIPSDSDCFKVIESMRSVKKHDSNLY